MTGDAVTGVAGDASDAADASDASDAAGPQALPTWDDLSAWWRDTFTDGADVEYERQILPLAAELLAGCRRILDIGTGEGQLARRLVGACVETELVVGLDPFAGQLANARARGGGPHYLRGRGEFLPFADAAFDGVVCCLVIEHADDADAVLAEVVRVVAEGGRFLLLINHPIVQGPGSGMIDDAVLGERYWRIGPYIPEKVNVEEVDKGVKVAFAHRPLSRYINPLAERGMPLVRMEEPSPPFEFLAGSVDMELERAMPRLCAMVFEKR